MNEKGQLIDNSFFTNKNGGFLIEGLEPGIYRIITDRSELPSVKIEVKETPGSVINLGDILLKEDGR